MAGWRAAIIQHPPGAVPLYSSDSLEMKEELASFLLGTLMQLSGNPFK